MGGFGFAECSTHTDGGGNLSSGRRRKTGRATKRKEVVVSGYFKIPDFSGVDHPPRVIVVGKKKSRDSDASKSHWKKKLKVQDDNYAVSEKEKEHKGNKQVIEQAGRRNNSSGTETSLRDVLKVCTYTDGIARGHSSAIATTQYCIANKSTACKPPHGFVLKTNSGRVEELWKFGKEEESSHYEQPPKGSPQAAERKDEEWASNFQKPKEVNLTKPCPSDAGLEKNRKKRKAIDDTGASEAVGDGNRKEKLKKQRKKKRGKGTDNETLPQEQNKLETNGTISKPEVEEEEEEEENERSSSIKRFEDVLWQYRYTGSGTTTELSTKLSVQNQQNPERDHSRVLSNQPRKKNKSTAEKGKKNNKRAGKEEKENNVRTSKEKKKDKKKTPPGLKLQLSTSQKHDEAYRRKDPDNSWQPPRSEFRLLQEDHLDDPWKVLIICMLLNRTSGPQAKRVLGDLFKLCPNAKAATEASAKQIEEIISSLGLQRKRAEMIQRFSREYLEEGWTHVTQLHGIGKYAADAYAIFCTGMWGRVVPADYMLNYYWEFLHSSLSTA